MGVLLVTGTVTGLGLYGAIAFDFFSFSAVRGFNFPIHSTVDGTFTEAGSASALMGALQMLLGSLASAAVGMR